MMIKMDPSSTVAVVGVVAVAAFVYWSMTKSDGKKLNRHDPKNYGQKRNHMQPLGNRKAMENGVEGWVIRHLSPDHKP